MRFVLQHFNEFERLSRPLFCCNFLVTIIIKNVTLGNFIIAASCTYNVNNNNTRAH